MMQPNWSDWFTNLASNDAGNKNMAAYSDTFESGHLDIENYVQWSKKLTQLF